MPKILIITDNLPSQINGVVTTYKNIQPYAINEGYVIEYIHPGRYLHINCPKYKEVKLSLVYASKIGKDIIAANPDYIHIATEGPIGLAARVYLTRHRYPYSTAYHTRFPEALKVIINIPEILTWYAIRWFHKHSKHILTTTPSMAECLKSHNFTNTITAWTRGVDRSVFTPIFKKPDDINLLYVGRLSKEKNIEAFLSLKTDFKKIVVGDGPYKTYLQNKYPKALFVGYKHGVELAEYYQQASVLVFPSKCDTFGIVQIEAMACGTPVAAYPVLGPSEVIEQNVTGYMHEDLNIAVSRALLLDRYTVYNSSKHWSWEQAWIIFKNCLVANQQL